MNDEKEVLQKVREDLEILEAMIAKHQRAMKINRYFGIILFSFIPVVIGLLISNFFFPQIEPYLDFFLALFSTFVVIYMIYTRSTLSKDFWKSSKGLTFLRVISWILIIFNLCNVANYIVTVFNIQINLF